MHAIYHERPNQEGISGYGVKIHDNKIHDAFSGMFCHSSFDNEEKSPQFLDKNDAGGIEQKGSSGDVRINSTTKTGQTQISKNAGNSVTVSPRTDVKTGDDTQVNAWMFLAVCALGLIIILAILQK